MSKKRISKELEKILDREGIRHDSLYSGRYMFGETCLALYTDSPSGDEEVGRITVEVVGAGKEQLSKEWADLIPRMRKDSLGKGGVTYFPGWEDSHTDFPQE